MCIYIYIYTHMYIYRCIRIHTLGLHLGADVHARLEVDEGGELLSKG